MCVRVSTFDRLADLPITVDGYGLEGLRAEVSSGFERLSTVVHLHGGGETGIGEDVVYDGVDQEALQKAGQVHDLAGTYALGELCERIDGLDLFPVAPQRDVSRLYRRWTFHSAALDLALAQAEKPLHEVLGRDPQPLTFVVSLRLGEPPSLEPIERPGGFNSVNATGANFRRIIDFANLDKTMATNAPGESAQPGSPYYGNTREKLADGVYFNLPFSRANVEKVAAHTLTLAPK